MTRFPERVKKKIRDYSDLRCCIAGCHEPDIDIHHIVPRANGGESTEDNAAPLCARCHRRYGGDPTKRKMIRDHRDKWYRMVAGKETGAVVRPSPYMFFGNCRYSFVRDELIHPLVLKELLGWMSDNDETVVAVNLTAANRSNRLSGNFTTFHQNGTRFVRWQEGPEFFTYNHIATSPSGIEMVLCSYCGGGSGVFRSVGLFYLEHDRAVDFDNEKRAESKCILTRERAVIRTLGSVPLGDRYDGEITYIAGVLSIGPDVGWYKRGEAAVHELEVP